MRFKLSDLNRHSERCKGKLMEEICETYRFRTLHDEQAIANFAFSKADEIINDFMHEGINSRRLMNDKSVRFNMQYCVDNKIDEIELTYKDSAVTWQGFERKS